MANIVANAFWTFVWKTVESYALSAITNKLFGHKTNSSSPTYSFGTLQTQVNSGLVMPLIYGEVKCAGNVLWADDGKTVQNKLIGFGVGRIKGFSDIRINDSLLQAEIAFNIKNTVYPDATVNIYKKELPFPTANDKVLSLFANGVTTNIILAGGDDDIGKSMGIVIGGGQAYLMDYNCYVNKLAEHINTLGNGWVATTTSMMTSAETIYDIPVTNCFKNGIGVVVPGLPGCSCTAYVGDGEQLIDSRVTGATQEEKARLVGGMKYDAYLAITATASEKVGSDYTVTTIVKGRIVKIYTSPTTYYEDWSDNPAWCFLDYMTSVDACGMTASETDIQGCLNAATYFDQIVNGKKRFTVNLILDEKKSHQDWINEILATCRSYRTYQRGMHGILVDKPESVSQIFNVKPDEDIEIWWQDLEEDIERLQITYIDPDYEYSKVIAQADKVALAGQQQFRNKIPLTKKIEVYGINNFEQASRESWFHLNKAQICPEWIRYKTNKRALNRTIGDVVGIYDPITKVTEAGLAYKRYRIMTMSEPQGLSIEMVMQEYNPNLYGDTMGSVAPTINVTKLANPYAIPPGVTDLTLEEYGWMNLDGTHISTIDSTWKEVDYQFLNDYIISISDDNGSTWRTAGTSNNPSYRISNVVTGKTYLVSIQVRNKSGLLSNRTIQLVKITGKDNLPQDVANFTVTQAGVNLIATISLGSEPDISLYELRMGYSWQNSVFIGTFTTNKYIFEAPQEGTLTFLCKAKDNFGNYSKTESEFPINVFGLPKKNIVYQKVEDLSTWQAEGMYYTAFGTWKIKSNEILGDFDLFANIFDSSPTLVSNPSLILPVIDLGPNIIEDGYYYIDPWGNIKIKSVETLGSLSKFADLFNTPATLQEVKYIAETFLSIDVNYNKTINTGVDIEYRVSVDGQSFGPWVSSINKQFFGRYVQQRLLPKSYDGVTNVEITGCIEKIDVPDVEDNIPATNIPAVKTHINFNRKFFATPNDVAVFTSDLTGKSATHYMTNLTKDGFDLEILDKNDNLIAGIMQSARIRGY